MASRKTKMLGRSQNDASDAIHDFSCSPCSEDGKNTDALYHCSICQMFYCLRCVDVHSKFTKNHKVTDKTSDTFGQGLGKSTTSSSDLPTDLCEEHHGEVVKMFCPQHDVVCCTVCIAVKHRSCEGVEYIPNIARGLLKKQGKEKTKTSLEKVKADLKNMKLTMEDDLKDLDKKRDGIIDDIQEFKKRIIARVEELEKKSLKEVRSKHKQLADDINAYSKKIDGLLKVIDTRLNKLTPSNGNNEAQQFVDVKNAEKESCNGADLVKQAISRHAKTMKFEMNKDIDVRLSKEKSFGSLKECTAGQACVNIVCPIKTEITDAFISELKAQLMTLEVDSEYMRLTEIVAGRYTIVLCEYDNAHEAVKMIRGIQENTIILITLIDYNKLCGVPLHMRAFKSECTIWYEPEQNIDLPRSISFAIERNKQTYKDVSDILKGNSSSN